MVILLELSCVIVAEILASLYYKGRLKGWGNFPTTVYKKEYRASKGSLSEDCINCLHNKRRMK
jgi:hypothetical protein